MLINGAPINSVQINGTNTLFVPPRNSSATAVPPTTQFGVPTMPRYLFAGALQPQTLFGPTVAFSVPVPPQQNWVTRAQGWSTTAFGRPTVVSTTTQQASGWQATGNFGRAQVRLVQPAMGWQTTNLGTVAAVVRVFAQGFRNTAFGADRSVVGRMAAPIRPTARFGPRAVARFRRNVASCGAEGLVITAGFGTASARPLLRARHHAPSTRFGRATVRRATVC